MSEGQELRVIAAPHPFLTERVDMVMVAGGTVAEILEKSGIKFIAAIDARICINDRVLAREQWNTYVPAPNDVIILRAIPRKGDAGKNVLRVVMTIALIAAMPAVGVLAGTAIGTLAPGLIGTGAFVLSTAAQIGVMYGGMALINHLCPPSRSSAQTAADTSYSRSQSFGLDGASNLISQWNPIPVILGTHKIFPPYAAKPYTSLQGTDQYLHCLFCVGYGPLQIEEGSLKIDNTPLSDYRSGNSPDDNLAYVIHQCYDPGEELAYFSESIDEIAVGVKVNQADGWITRTTEPALVSQISIDVSCPYGLIEYLADGTKDTKRVFFEIQYKRHDDDDSQWSAAGDGKAFSYRPSLISKPPQVTSRVLEGGQYVTGVYDSAKWTHLFINKSTGALKQTSSGNISLAFYTIEQIWEMAQVWAYSSPGADYTPLALIVRTSDKDTIEASDIMDLRTSELQRANPDDFLVSAIDPGTYVLPPLYSGLPLFDLVNVAGGTLVATRQLSGKTTNAVRKTILFGDLQGNGVCSYDVRIRRISQDNASSRIIDGFYWDRLRTSSGSAPVMLPGLTLIEMRIRATNLLNGILTNFNCVATSLIKGYNSSTEEWEDNVATNNPAALLRYVFQGAPNKRAVEDSQLNLDELTDFHEECERQGYTFNQIVDYQASVEEIARNVAAAGRAALTFKDGKFSVIMDRERTDIIQHFTPHNSWGFKGRKEFVQIPHAFRVRFADENTDYQSSERLVFADGYDESSATLIEELKLPGITNGDLGWRHGRYYIKCLQLRSEEYTFNTDIESLVCTRGDLIRVMHDAVPEWAMGSGRVKALLTSGGNTTGVLMDTPFEMPYPTSYAIRFRLSDGTSLVRFVAEEVGGSFTELTFTAPIATPEGPQIGDLAMFGVCGINKNMDGANLIIKSIRPKSDLTAEITAVDYAPEVYDDGWGEAPPAYIPVSGPADAFAPEIESVVADESVATTLSNGTYVARIRIVLFPLPSIDLFSIASIEVQYRITDSENAWSSMTASKDSATIYISGVDVGETYDVRVRYVFSDGRTGLWASSDGVEVSASAENIDDTVATLAAELISSVYAGGNFSFAWAATNLSLSVNSYTLEIYSDSGYTAQLYTTGGLAAGAFTLTRAQNASLFSGTPSRTLYVKVSVTDSYGRTASTTQTVTHAAPAFSSGYSPAVTASTSGFAVSWSAVDGATGYIVRWGTTNPPSGGSSATVSGTSTFIPGLTPNTTYYVDVIPFDDLGNGDVSSATERSSYVNDTPTASGLYSRSSYIGYYDEDYGWRNYIADTGTFKFVQSEAGDDDELTSSMLSNSGLDSFTAANLLDDSTSTVGFTCDSCADGSYLTIDTGEGAGKFYGKLRLYMSDAGFTRTFAVAYSDNGSSWTPVATGWIPSASGWNEITWGNVGKHRYWKLTAGGTAAAGPDIMEMEWYTADSYLGFDGANLNIAGTLINVSSAAGIAVAAGGGVYFTGHDTNPAKARFVGSSGELSLYADALGYVLTLYSTYGGNARSLSIDVSVPDLSPGQHKAFNLGKSTAAFDTIFADDFTDVADFPFFDELDDLACIRQIQPFVRGGEYVRDAVTGHVLIDDETLPDCLVFRHKTTTALTKQGEIARTPDGKPYVPLKAAVALAWGAIKQMDDHYSKRIAELQLQLDKIAPLKNG